jgi:hypothetical protein
MPAMAKAHLGARKGVLDGIFGVFIGNAITVGKSPAIPRQISDEVRMP